MAQSTETKGFAASQSSKRTLIELGALLVGLVVLFFAGRLAIGCAAESVAEHLPVSIDEQIGKTAAEQMRTKYNLGEKPSAEQIARVDRIFNELKNALTDQEKTILKNPRVTVVVDSQVNAFALPGGEVFVLTGLLERVGPKGDDLIRGVLAHELGHAVKRHGVRGLARSAAFGVVLAFVIGEVDDVVVTLAAGASKLDGLSHSRDMETEADLFGLDLLQRAGYTGEGLAEFLESLGSQPVPELLSTHPDPVERAAAIRKRVGSTER
ncbi:MAG TPA: M48 family metallopeptidase [Polyangiaceae bacterium]|nr:M48 family metallopeptidase [Polyangiaceae bacterium]